MRFSEKFNVVRSDDDDWFDLLLNQDTPLYIDPFLVFDDGDPRWKDARADVTAFYELALRRVIESGGKSDSPAWISAVNLLRCPEPNEFALGLSVGDPQGSGVGKVKAERIARVLDIVKGADTVALSSIAGFAIFVEGMGVDLISDTLCNILKSHFIKYTQDVATRHGVKTESIPVKNHSWDRNRGRWISGRVTLPFNPMQKSAVLLTPERFLQDIPMLEPEQFWNWAENEGEQLRVALNIDLAKELSKSEKVAHARAAAKRRPELAIQFLTEFNNTYKAEPYDVGADPKGLVQWYERGQQLAANSEPAIAPEQRADVPKFVHSLALSFKEEVEERDGWKVLWDAKRKEHAKEEVSQALAGAMWRTQCKAAGIDISKEVNMGRGPVDFKFSRGWEARALLEVKHIGATAFFTGAGRQIPQYLKSESIDSAVYLAIGFTDADFGEQRLKRVTETCESLQEQKGMTVIPVFVDARPHTKVSASRQK